MKRLFISLGWIVTILFANGQNIDTLLDQLDREVAAYPQTIAEKEANIQRLRESFEVANFASEKYLLCEKLFHEYEKFNGDSALFYAQAGIELAQKEGRRDWEIESQINRAQIYVARNVQPYATELIERIGDIDSIPEEIRPYFATVVLNNIVRRNREFKEGQKDLYEQWCRDAWNKYSPFLPEENFKYPHLMFVMNPTDSIEVTEELTKRIQLAGDDNDKKALLEYILALQLQAKGNQDGYVEHLIKSAIYDLKQCNRECQSLILLLNALGTNPKHLERTYRYAAVCEDNIITYKDTGRSLSLLTSQASIRKGYFHLISKQKTQLISALIIVIALLGCVIGLILLLRKKNKKLSLSYHELEAINGKLRNHISAETQLRTEVEKKNQALKDEMRQRDRHFASTFFLCSNYIKQVKNFQKSITLTMRTGSLSAIKKAVEEPVLNENELHDLYQAFDKAYLDIHPDFIGLINELLAKNGQFNPKDDYLLSPELRVAALMSLGITDNNEIADFLHYTVQTIYNYRFKLRKAAQLPDAIENQIKNLYNK